jgi:diaminopimelate decarboxylase
MSYETPYLLMNLPEVSRAFHQLLNHFPQAGIYYAVKANPAPEIVRLLLRLGSCFDVASPAEIDLCLQCGAKAEDLSYGNTIKKSKDIAYAFEKGVRLFSFDSADILYEKNQYHLPLALSIGDKLEILSTGAYTSSYASVGFNGFKPLPTYFLETK